MLLSLTSIPLISALTYIHLHCSASLFLFLFQLPILPRVPFAQPPLGKLRLKDPVPKKGWIGVNLNKYGVMPANMTPMILGLLCW